MSGGKPTPTVNELFNRAFAPDTAREPRSDAYKEGVRAALRFRIEGVRVATLYPSGTPQADAFYAGVDEGHALWRAAGGTTRDG